MPKRSLVAILFALPVSVLAAPPRSVPEVAPGLAPAVAFEVAPQVVRLDSYPAVQVAFQNGVRGIPDLVYRRPIGYRPLTLDLYLPPVTLPRPAPGFPLVVYIHGGGWAQGDRRQNWPFFDFPGVLASLSARGYVVASIDYRLSSEATFPAQAEDVKAAIRWIRSRAPQYGVDPAKAMTWGASAGGHLAALAAVSCNVPALESAQTIAPVATATGAVPIVPATVSDCVQGAVTWFGVFDFATIAAQARESGSFSRDVADVPEWRLLGCFASECEHGQIAAASPVTYVNATNPPMLLIVGTDDTIVPYKQTLEMAEKLKTRGVPHQVMVLPGINHSFLGKTPEQTRDANLKALDATFRFIDRTMKTADGDRGGMAAPK